MSKAIEQYEKAVEQEYTPGWQDVIRREWGLKETIASICI